MDNDNSVGEKYISGKYSISVGIQVSLRCQEGQWYQMAKVDRRRLGSTGSSSGQ